MTVVPEGWVDPPGPTSSGVADTCNKWYLVQNGDTCAAIAAEFGLTLAEFHEMNQGINANCGNLRASFAVCVRMWVEEQEPEPTTTTTTTAGPPGPTATGTSPTCTK